MKQHTPKQTQIQTVNRKLKNGTRAQTHMHTHAHQNTHTCAHTHVTYTQTQH